MFFFFKGSAPRPPFWFSQCVKHPYRIIRKDMFFFSFRVVLSCQKASYREIRNETEDLIEVSYRYCSFIQNFTVRTTCTMRGSLIKSSQFQTRSHKGVSHETRMLKFMKKKDFKLLKELLTKSAYRDRWQFKNTTLPRTGMFAWSRYADWWIWIDAHT